MILDDFRLDGRVAPVTGGNRGLGQGCAVALAEAGADIALLGRGDPAETAKLISAAGRRVIALFADLAVARPGLWGWTHPRVGLAPWSEVPAGPRFPA